MPYSATRLLRWRRSWRSHSAYGHIETMAQAVAEGARDAGAQVDIKPSPELVPDEVARKSH